MPARIDNTPENTASPRLCTAPDSTSVMTPSIIQPKPVARTTKVVSVAAESAWLRTMMIPPKSSSRLVMMLSARQPDGKKGVPIAAMRRTTAAMMK